MNDSLDLDDVLGEDAQPQEVKTSPAVVKVPAVDHVAETKPTSRGWSIVAFILAACLMFGLGMAVAHWRSGGDDVPPDVDPVSGTYVAIFYDDAEIQDYTPSQLEFLNSVNTANWLEERKADWQKIDEQDDVSRLPKPFQVMAEKHRSKLPWIVIASGKKFASEPIESNDQAMKLLERVVK